MSLFEVFEAGEPKNENQEETRNKTKDSTLGNTLTVDVWAEVDTVFYGTETEGPTTNRTNIDTMDTKNKGGIHRNKEVRILKENEKVWTDSVYERGDRTDKENSFVDLTSKTDTTLY